MRTILFVDDEQRILQGIERMLRAKRSSWKMIFVTSGAEALNELSQQHFDVIVSDMRMPEMDGAALLQKVQQLYPHIVRIVLSGYAEMEMALRAVPVAHQFLSKPCDAKHLEEVVDRACQLQALLSDEELRDVVGKLNRLPAMPKVYQALTQAFSKPETSVKEISAIVEQDMAISAKVLQLVNSAFFSLSRRITSISTAVSCLGLTILKHLALSVEVFRSFPEKNGFNNFLPEELQAHALLTAHIAKRMFSDKQKSEDAFIAGMLHDVGELILIAHLPDKFSQAVQMAQNEKISLYSAEKKVFGISHTEIGAYLLGIWGLPYPVIEAVANHHEPRRVKHQNFDILCATYVATHLADTQDAGSKDELDMQYLEELGVVEQLPQWQAIAEELTQKKESGLI